jgi:hypothetical protein
VAPITEVAVTEIAVPERVVISSIIRLSDVLELREVTKLFPVPVVVMEVGARRPITSTDTETAVVDATSAKPVIDRLFVPSVQLTVTDVDAFVSPVAVHLEHPVTIPHSVPMPILMDPPRATP